MFFYRVYFMWYYYFYIVKISRMLLNSKIKIFLSFLLLFIFLNSCKKEKNDVIPYAYVYFTIDLNDAQFLDLISTFGSVLVNSSTNNWKYSGGYNNNGIIVFNGGEQFYAYDRTCPHDYAVNGLSIKVNVVGVYAECPECKTSYLLPSGGNPASSSVGKYPLKNYRTSIYGNSVTVSNY